MGEEIQANLFMSFPTENKNCNPMFSGGIEIFYQGNVLLKFNSSVHNILLEMSVVIFSLIFRNYGSTTGYPWVKRKCLRNLYACETLSIVTTRNIECISNQTRSETFKSEWRTI